MIAYLSGKIIDKDEQSIVLDVNGVGYRVFISTGLNLSVKISDKLEIWTHNAIRENSNDLYGFREKTELEMFNLLLTISGIGPKSAISILNTASTETLAEGIQSGDPTYLAKISGISKKNSEKIVLNLKDKLGVGFGEVSENYKDDNSTAIDALVALGYSEKESREVIQKVAKDFEKDGDNISNKDAEKIIKKALKKLSGN